jgi:invasion protein IalB
MRKPQLLLAICGVFLAASCSLAQAQQQTTATYGDWTVRCVVAEGQKAKQCEMIQTANVQGQSNPISQIAIGRPAKTDPVKIVFQLPVGIWLPGGAKLVFDAKAAAIDASFKRCLPAACFADAELKDDVIKKWRAVTEPGKLNFEDGNRKPAAVPVSFKGFGEAFDALAKE